MYPQPLGQWFVVVTREACAMVVAEDTICIIICTKHILRSSLTILHDSVSTSCIIASDTNFDQNLRRKRFLPPI